MNFYKVLHVTEDAPNEIIKLAYKGLVQKYHPDIYKGDDASQKMVELREAYETLIDPIKRKSYDETLRRIQAQKEAREKSDRQTFQDKIRRANEEAKQAQEAAKQAQAQEAARKAQAQETTKQAKAQEANKAEESKEIAKIKFEKAQQRKKIIYGICGFFVIIAIAIPFIMQPKKVEEAPPYNDELMEASSETVSESPASESLELVSDESHDVANDDVVNIDIDAVNNDVVNNDVAVEITKSLEEQKRLIRYDDSLLEKAINNLFRVMDNSGSIGLRKAIEDCYANNKDKKYCFYLDFSATIFEVRVAEEMNVSVHEFYSEDAFRWRVVNDYYNKIGVDDNSLRDFQFKEIVSKIVEKINNKLS